MAFPSNWQWRNTIDEPGNCAIFDLDGVLADANQRQHFLEWPRRDWGGFFRAAADDTILDDTAQLLHILGTTLQTVLLTARPINIRPQTLTWLDEHAIAYDLLVMRPDHDRRPSSLFKRDMLNDLREIGFSPQISFEDDIRNVEMFRNQGVPCVYIHSGYYD